MIFPRNVTAATAGLYGNAAECSADDHHNGRLEMSLDTSISANTVTVNGVFGLRDWSGN